MGAGPSSLSSLESQPLISTDTSNNQTKTNVQVSPNTDMSQSSSSSSSSSASASDSKSSDVELLNLPFRKHTKISKYLKKKNYY